MSDNSQLNIGTRVTAATRDARRKNRPPKKHTSSCGQTPTYSLATPEGTGSSPLGWRLVDLPVLATGRTSTTGDA
jgi:hypothetical protein